MKKWARGLVVCAAAAVLSIWAGSMAYAAEGEINVNGTGVVQADPIQRISPLKSARTAKQHRRHRRKTTALPRQ